MKYQVGTIRKAGLEAKWIKTRCGAPMIAARKNKHCSWFAIDCQMWNAMKKEGIRKAFEEHTLLGDVFSVPA